VGGTLPFMHLRRLIPAAVFTLLVAAAPASAATESAVAGPSPTPLILEVGLAVVVAIALAVREPVGRAFTAARRRVSGSRPARATRASEQAPSA
jgi:hypothetical protein